jgi:hypothetical protein
MNSKDECVCDHPKSGHFDSTGRCAVIVCHCTGFEAKSLAEFLQRVLNATPKGE